MLTPWAAVRDALAGVAPGWLGAALAAVALSAAIGALATWATVRGGAGASGEGQGEVRFATLLAVGVAASFTGRLLPEYGSAGLTAHALVRAGVPRDAAVRRMAGFQATSVAVHAVVLVLLVLAAVVVGTPPGVPLREEWVVWVFVLVMLALGSVSLGRRLRTLVIRPDRRAVRDVGELRSDPARLALLVGSSVGLAVVDGLVVLASVRAFGASAPVVGVLAASLLATAVAVLSPTPDGAGVIEAVLVLALVWAGVDAGPAVAGALGGADPALLVADAAGVVRPAPAPARRRRLMPRDGRRRSRYSVWR